MISVPKEKIEPNYQHNPTINQQKMVIKRVKKKYMDPRAVPRIVCGLRNLQQESLRSDRVFDKGAGPAASA